VGGGGSAKKDALFLLNLLFKAPAGAIKRAANACIVMNGIEFFKCT
jgi:hypothetical protein